MFNVCFIYQSI